jgi:hypothetical protein
MNQRVIAYAYFAFSIAILLGSGFLGGTGPTTPNQATGQTWAISYGRRFIWVHYATFPIWAAVWVLTLAAAVLFCLGVVKLRQVNGEQTSLGKRPR